jgi:succinate dehydrogenase flavin-adding protein (antitoxin of CptAB toxin-antitoxin module)
MASEVEQRTFAQFLELQDDVIFDYLFGSSQPDAVELLELVNKIKTVLHTPA